MAQYNFETTQDFMDELVRVVSPRDLADYMYNHFNQYSLDLQWELDSKRLDELYGEYESFEEYADSQLELDLP